MKRAFQLLAAAGVCAALAACTTTTQRPEIDATATAVEREKQAALFVETRLEELKRVHDIGHKVLTANAELCPYKKSDIGMETLTVHDLDRRLRSGGVAALGLSDVPEVVWVAPNGGAARAGLREGDEITSVNGKTIPLNSRATQYLERELENALERNPPSIPIGYRRGAEERRVEVPTQQICGYRLRLVDEDSINAAATGDSILITRGILRFTPKDEELALVVAHELAHNSERHIRARMVNSLPGLVLDVLAAGAGVNTGGAFSSMTGNLGSSGFEAEADYVGMYYMARAGFETDGVERFWRRMAIENPRSIFVRSSHPAGPERFVAIAATHREIEAKEAARQPLVPNRRARETPRTSSGSGR